jgi:hypothetical protein
MQPGISAFTCGATALPLRLFLPVATPNFWLKSATCQQALQA